MTLIQTRSRCTLTLASPVAENTPTGQLGLAKARRRGKLLLMVKASMLLGLLSEFGPVRGAGATERAFGSAARQYACAWPGDVKKSSS